MMITITFLNFYFARAFGRVYLMKKVEENAGIRVRARLDQYLTGFMKKG